MIFRGASLKLVVAFVTLAFGATACDKLGGTKKDESSASDDDSSSKKKKKKKKKAEDDDDDEAPSATPTASATASASATPTATPSATAEPTAAPTASASAAPDASSGDVKRYSDETPDHGDLNISKPSPAHKEAQPSSEIVITLQPGSQVQKVARWGTWSLVSWKNKSGEHFGWIDNKKTTTITDRDAGPAQIEGLDKRPFDAGKVPTPTPSSSVKH